MVALMLLILSGTAHAQSTVTVNGKSYSCDGSLSVVNGVATCDGKSLDGKGGAGADKPCGGAPVHRFRNADGSEGGWVNNKARVEASVFVDHEAKLCGTDIDIRGNVALGAVIISGSAKINGRDSKKALAITGGIFSGTLDLDGTIAIKGAPIVSGMLKMRERAKVIGSPIISGSVQLGGDSTLAGSSVISGTLTLAQASKPGVESERLDPKSVRPAPFDDAIALLETPASGSNRAAQ